MAPITEELVRKRAEHNEGHIGSLEELSLHQLDIQRIENVDKWCPHLKIFYLQGNLISKIENVRKLKNLTYLNLAMNNLTRIENLEGCESLSKLDLTLNFIRKLSDVDRLNENYNLRELYLTGNPCASYDGYRSFVIIKLAQLKILDGKLIERSERIVALQNSDKIQRKILEQEEEENEEITKEEVEVTGGSETSLSIDDEDTFWTEKTKHAPETRLKLHRHLQGIKGDSRGAESFKKIGFERKLTSKDGRLLNINEPRVEFHLMDDVDDDKVVLDVSVYRYLETSLIEVEIEPNYVQVFIKQKLLQLVLNDEVKPDQSIVQRSLTTGHLIVTMPKVQGTLKPKVKTTNNHKLHSQMRTKENKNHEKKNTFESKSNSDVDPSDVPELI